jgi:hypothetical protein
MHRGISLERMPLIGHNQSMAHNTTNTISVSSKLYARLRSAGQWAVRDAMAHGWMAAPEESYRSFTIDAGDYEYIRDVVRQHGFDCISQDMIDIVYMGVRDAW